MTEECQVNLVAPEAVYDKAVECGLIKPIGNGIGRDETGRIWGRSEKLKKMCEDLTPNPKSAKQ